MRGVQTQHFQGVIQLPDEWFDQTTAETASFVFDAFPSEIHDFGTALLREDLFSLPFNSCYFEWMFEGRINGMIAQRQSGDEILLWMCVQSPDLTGAGLPLSFSLNRLAAYVKERGEVTGYVRARASFKTKEVLQHYGESFETIIKELVTCIALLNAKGVLRDRVEVSPRVNERRRAQGRTLLPSYTILRLARYRAAQASMGRGGTHASPAPHFRRGHIRTLESGKKTIVRPAWVLAEPGSMPRYTVKAGERNSNESAFQATA
jgi:hypothetical protein